jgi:hypothetical protein
MGGTPGLQRCHRYLACGDRHERLRKRTMASADRSLQRSSKQFRIPAACADPDALFRVGSRAPGTVRIRPLLFQQACPRRRVAESRRCRTRSNRALCSNQGPTNRYMDLSDGGWRLYAVSDCRLGRSIPLLLRDRERHVQYRKISPARLCDHSVDEARSPRMTYFGMGQSPSGCIVHVYPGIEVLSFGSDSASRRPMSFRPSHRALDLHSTGISANESEGSLKSKPISHLSQMISWLSSAEAGIYTISTICLPISDFCPATLNRDKCKNLRPRKIPRVLPGRMKGAVIANIRQVSTGIPA